MRWSDARATYKKNSPDRLVEGVELSIGERLVVQVIGVLYVDGVSHSVALCDRRLREVLTTTQLLQNARALVLTLKLLQGALDVLALLYSRDNHSCILFLFFCNSFFFVGSLWRSSRAQLFGCCLLGFCLVHTVDHIGRQSLGLLLGQYVLFN